MTREELYGLVWSVPMTKIGEKFGYSDNGIRKICKKYNIPTPKAGYWQKIEFGKSVKKTPLPELEVEQIEIRKVFDGRQKIKPDKTILSGLLKEQKIKNKIRVSKSLSNPHPLVSLTKKKCTTDFHYPGCITVHGGGLNIRVGKNNLQRALRIYDALIKALEKRSIKVFLSDNEDHKGSTCVEVMDETFGLAIQEKLKRVKSDREYSNTEYAPEGSLRIRLLDAWGRRAKMDR